MGLLAEALRNARPKAVAAASIPTWQQDAPQTQATNGPGYDPLARQGYMRDELVFACVEARATSAAEPRLVVYQGGDDEKVTRHPALDLLQRPNPFMSGFTFWASVMLHLDVGGNAYVEKVRSMAGKVVELWLMRPDRVRVIPDAKRLIGGYRYTIGDKSFTLPPEDVIHFKTRHPLDDFYGLSPLSVLARRVDLDNWTREFSAAFFRNAGVPAGLLNIQRAVTQQEREMLRARFRQQTGGPEGWHQLLVMDGMEATYTPMGLPIGPRGVAVPELDEINEARICMVFGVPPSLISTRVGMHSSSYGNRESDRRIFWEGTLAPLYRDLSGTLTHGLQPDFPDVDRFEFDISTIQALMPDQDQLHARLRSDMQAGGITREEFRLRAGYPEEPEAPGTFLIPVHVVETSSDAQITKPESGAQLNPAEAAAGRGKPAK